MRRQLRAVPTPNAELKQPGPITMLWLQFRQRRRRAKVARGWQGMGPGEQLGTFIHILDSTPELRREFRRVLRVRGYEK